MADPATTSKRTAMNRFEEAAINLMGWATVGCEPAGESAAFWRVVGPRRSSRNVAESDIATMRKSIADYIDSAVKQATSEAFTEIVRLRKALNQIAWPQHFGISQKEATTEMYRHIAMDALAIGKIGVQPNEDNNGF